MCKADVDYAALAHHNPHSLRRTPRRTRGAWVERFMGNTLAALYRLQTVETQLADLRNRIAAKQRAVQVQEKRLAQLDAELAADAREHQTRQMDVDRMDLEIKTREVEIAKQRAALNLAKTNKEYSSILTQLNTAKVDTGKFEERGLELMGQVDEVKKRVAERRAQRDVEVQRLDTVRGETASFEAGCKDRLDALTKQRATMTADVPETALKLFERVALKNDGHAMALVVRTNPKREEYACESCNMSITLQQVNALMSRDEPVLCHVCGHILFLEAQTATMR